MHGATIKQLILIFGVEILLSLNLLIALKMYI